jgi:SOS-response transcriptional repressor LexA
MEQTRIAMNDLRDTIQERLRLIGKSARRASLDGGLHRDAIRNILRTKSKNPRRDTLAGIARGLDWSLEELLDLPGHRNVSGMEQPVFDVPLISWVQAGALNETIDPYEIGHAEEYVAVTHKRSTLIALRVQGTSMNRVAADGSVIIVDFADKILISGQYYVVKLNGEATFKRFRVDPSRLEPDSTEPFDTVFLRGEAEVVGRVIQVITRLT